MRRQGCGCGSVLTALTLIIAVVSAVAAIAVVPEVRCFLGLEKCPGNQTTDNPDLGVFETTFDADAIVHLRHGYTLGGNSICVPHPIHLEAYDVGKLLNADLNNWNVSPEGSSRPFLSLYRSYIDTNLWFESEMIDLLENPMAEQVVYNPGATSLSWTVSRLGQYVLCLEIPLTEWEAGNITFEWATYTVLLTGG